VRAHGRRPRAIGAWGTAARLVVGVGLVWLAVTGGTGPRFEIRWWEALLGIVALPAGFAALQIWRARTRRAPLRACGGLACCVNCAALAALLILPWTNAATLLFLGSGMLVAAWRGYAGCESLAISNWLLGRDDQVGCMIFSPLDRLEMRRRIQRTPNAGGRAARPLA
jgi:hypothetical protein